MESHQPNRIVVATTQLQSRSREWQVVLAAAGIASTVHHEQGHWHLSVAASDAARSREELGAFEQENAIDNVGSAITDLDAAAEFDAEQERIAHHSNRKPAANVYSGAVVGGLSFLVVITFCQILQVSDFGQINWFQLGSMHAGDVRSGQWWRAVTALVLHRDTLHLMSNALFGSIFGYLVAKNIGGGAAWLAILASGSLGNLANAYTRPVEHTSIGVSTAVFGALGLLIAQAIQPKSVTTSPWQRFSPLVGGLILFFYLGIGDEQTDTAAHFYGLLSGLLIGGVMRSIPNQVFQKTDYQVWFGITAISIIVAAWSLAIVTS